MANRTRFLLALSAAFGVAAAIAVAASQSAATRLTVHEWGTFTSVAGEDGQAVNWSPLSGPQDLPCFVERHPIQVKGRDIHGLLIAPTASVAATRPAAPLVPAAFMQARIRMETPVLYFYSPDEVDVRVKVSFEQGVMSEWYPRATTSSLDVMRPLTTTVGTIEWPAVRVRPGARVFYPSDGSRSHYYAARDVDAAPVQVGLQHEQFLFYRGLGDFQPPIAATIGRNSDVTVAGTAAIPRLVLFANRGGRIGYRVASGADSAITLPPPDLTGSLDALRAELETMLTDQGLYSREAKAMVETWRDSWFEEGVRIFYLLPQAAIDQRLPLSISPAPADISRVFVGRLELITPEMKDDVERAIVQNDLDALNAYGRFLDSIVLQMSDRPSLSRNPTQVANALRAVSLTHPAARVCR
jgi:hypothetical protein